MKRVYRFEDNAAYWDRRWAEAGQDAAAFEDLTIYPIRYAEAVMSRNPGPALEIGCGLGRVLKHFSNQGRSIVGIERSAVAVERLRSSDPHLDVRMGDALDLPFETASMSVVMAFGVYHNFETGLERGLDEVARVLKPGGDFVISMRPNNLEMHLNEVYWRFRRRPRPNEAPRFHKLLVSEREFVAMLARVGLVATRVEYARNVSILFRLPFLRCKGIEDETRRRSRGYALNGAGQMLDRLLTAAFPRQFANVLVFTGTRAE